MLDRLIDEIPRFFTYYTILFLLQAMGTTLLMTLIGCVLGFVLGFVIVLLRQTPGLVWAPVRVRRDRLCRVLPAHPVPGHPLPRAVLHPGASRPTPRCSRWR